MPSAMTDAVATCWPLRRRAGAGRGGGSAEARLGEHGHGESATRVGDRPKSWKEEQIYVVVRLRPTRQGELLPRHAVIQASRDDLPLGGGGSPPPPRLPHHQAFHVYGQMACRPYAPCSSGCSRRRPAGRHPHPGAAADAHRHQADAQRSPKP